PWVVALSVHFSARLQRLCTRISSERGSASGLRYLPLVHSCCAGRAPASAASPSAAHDDARYVSDGASSPTPANAAHRRISRFLPTTHRLCLPTKSTAWRCPPHTAG